MNNLIKECPPGKILNPATKRCIDINGAIAKKLLALLKDTNKDKKNDKNDNDMKVDKKVAKVAKDMKVANDMKVAKDMKVVKDVKVVKDSKERKILLLRLEANERTIKELIKRNNELQLLYDKSSS